MRTLSQLEPGTRFRQPALGITGVLLKVNECRAVVRIDRPERTVEFRDRTGAVRRFAGRRYETTSWAPTVVVEPVSDSVSPFDEGRSTMAKKKTAKKTTTKKKTTGRKQAPGKKTAAKKGTAGKGGSKKAAGKKAAPKKTSAKKGATKKKAAAKKSGGQMSALDAAAKVLAESNEPMNTKEMIERMEAKCYWTSPGGKTPHATLYSGILRELQKKGKEARFKKVDRGKFTANT